MDGNLNPSMRVALVAAIAAQQAPIGVIKSPWIDMRNFYSAFGVLNVGAIGAGGTVDALIEQATDANGTGVKPVPNAAIAQVQDGAGDNEQSLINLRQENLDKNGGFRFARLSVSVGVASTFLSAELIGFDARYGSGTANQSTTVAQTVS